MQRVELNLFTWKSRGSGLTSPCRSCPRLTKVTLPETLNIKMLGFLRKNKNKIDGEWRKVSELEVGMLIAVPKGGIIDHHKSGQIESRASVDGDVLWDEIESIEYVGAEQVWDIEVEDTHNFVGNNIFAHNTYMSGNVGIGTASPTELLSLGNGAARKFWIENTATDVVGRALTVAAGGTVAGTSVSDVVGGNLILQSGLGTGTGASTISFQTGTTLTTGTTLQTMETKMTILGSGDVGIGTTGPLGKLHVIGTTPIILEVSTTEGIYLSGDTLNGGYSANGDYSLGINWTGYQNGATQYRDFVIYNGINQHIATFDGNTRNVGIGTTSPTNILSLGNGEARKFWIENTATDVVGRALTVAAGGTVAGTSVSDVVGGNLILQSGLGTGTGASTISFQTGTTLTTGTTLQTMETKMTILGSGDVGIGTTEPVYPFEVRKDGRNLYINYYYPLASKNTANTYGVLLGYDTSDGAGVISQNGLATDLKFTTNTGGVPYDRLIIKNDGLVGIGTTEPASKLDITTAGLATTQTTSSGLALVNTTAATAIAPVQISPAIRWSGFGWKTDATAASQAVDFRAFVTPVQGTSAPTGYLGFESSINGGAYSATPPFVITSAGSLGIGTAGPTTNLEIADDFAIGGGIKISDTGGGYFSLVQTTGVAGSFQPAFTGFATGDVSP